MLKPWWTICCPQTVGSGWWPKCGACSTAAWGPCLLSASIAPITTFIWSSLTRPKSVEPPHLSGSSIFKAMSSATTQHQRRPWTWLRRPMKSCSSWRRAGALWIATPCKITFLDIWNYLPAGGCSYAKYLSTYGRSTCEDGKSYVLWVYVGNLARLRDPCCPMRHFTPRCRRQHAGGGSVSSMGQENYAKLHWIWECKGMTSFHDLQVYCNTFLRGPMDSDTSITDWSWQPTTRVNSALEHA